MKQKMFSRIFTRGLVTSSKGNIPTHMKEFFEARAKLETFDRILTSKVYNRKQNLKLFKIKKLNLIIKKLNIISAPDNEGYVLGELKVEKTFLNAGNLMHGGALSTLFDAITTIALFNTPIRQPGVSVDLKLS